MLYTVHCTVYCTVTTLETVTCCRTRPSAPRRRIEPSGRPRPRLRGPWCRQGCDPGDGQGDCGERTQYGAGHCHRPQSALESAVARDAVQYSTVLYSIHFLIVQGNVKDMEGHQAGWREN
jgi:hypothetical protein